MTLRPNRARRVMKWVGLAACLVLLLTLVVEPAKFTTKSTEVWFHTTVIFFYQPVGPGIDDDMWHNWKVQIANNPGLLPQYRRIILRAGTLVYLSLPLRPFLCFMVIATCVLWSLDHHRFPTGCCQNCGYDLTGNESGVCSECGTEIEHPSPMMNAEREESGVVAGRGWFRDQQINAIKVEIKKRYADRIRSAESKAQKKALKTERDAEIAKQVKPLIRERQADGPDCV